MNIEAPYLVSNFPKDDLSFDKISDISRELHFQESLQNAELAVDLGSGLGNSAVALRSLVPNAQIHTVDMFYQSIREYNHKLLGDTHLHFSESLHDYLVRFEGMERKLDVVLIKAVPEHQLEKDGGYSLLSAAVAEGGIVLSIGDTQLDCDEMRGRFIPLFEKAYIPGSGVYIWQKK